LHSVDLFQFRIFPGLQALPSLAIIVFPAILINYFLAFAFPAIQLLLLFHFLALGFAIFIFINSTFSNTGY